MTDRTARDKQVDAWAKELAAIAAEELGDAAGPQQAIEFPAARITSFGNRFLSRLGEMITSAYVTAAGGIDKVTDAGWQAVAKAIDAQAAFANGFLGALRRGEVSPEQAQARAALYVGSTVAAYEQGLADAAGVDLPAMPGDGSTPCLGNCRCAWRIADDGSAYWHAVDDKGTCVVCRQRAEDWNPYVQELT